MAVTRPWEKRGEHFLQSFRTEKAPAEPRLALSWKKCVDWPVNSEKGDLEAEKTLSTRNS